MNDFWPIVGRDAELEVIDGVFDGSTGGGIVVAGAAGIGKSRLADAAGSAAADQSWRVLRIFGSPFGQPAPLSAFTQGVQDIDGSRPAAAGHVTEALRAQTADGLLLVVDDAHHLDAQTLDEVETLLISSCAKVVATVRSDEPAGRRVARSLVALGLVRLDLPPLSRTTVEQLLADVLGGPLNEASAQRLWLKTQGNVMFLRHLVEQERRTGRLFLQSNQWDYAPAAQLSQPLRDLVQMHIGAVADAVRDVLDVVAVAEVISPDLLAKLAPAGAVAEAVQRGLIVPDSCGHHRIGHPLYAEFALSCTAAELRQIRARVATAMARAEPGIAVDPVRLAVLWQEAALPPDPDILLAAADEAARRLDTAMSERLSRAAVSAGGGAAARARHARALHYLGRGEDAAAVLDTVTVAQRPREDQLDDAIMRASNLFWGMRQPDEARRVVEEALAVATGSRQHALRVFKALQLAFVGYPTDAMDIMGTVDLAQLSPSSRISARLVEMMALGELGAEYPAAKAADRELLLGDIAVDSFNVIVWTDARVRALTLAGRLDEVSAVVNSCRRWCADLPGTAGAASRGIAGFAALRSGDVRGAVRDLDPASLNFDDYGRSNGLAYRYLIYYAEALAVAGRAGDATEAMAAARADRHPGHAHLDVALLNAEAWVHAAHGHLTSARRSAMRAADLAMLRGQRAPAVHCLQTAVAFGQLGVESTLAELARRAEGPRRLIALRHARAVSAGDGKELDSLSKEFEQIGDLLAAAHTAAAATVVFRSQGLRGSALTVGGRAMDLARRCGAAQGPVIAELKVATALTGRTREVVVLVARGMTNREIAAALSATVTTVERHVRQACVKLGVRSRSELAVLVRAHDLVAADASPPKAGELGANSSRLPRAPRVSS